jgi:hypothetical protein
MTEFSAVPAYNPLPVLKRPLRGFAQRDRVASDAVGISAYAVDSLVRPPRGIIWFIPSSPLATRHLFGTKQLSDSYLEAPCFESIFLDEGP